MLNVQASLESLLARADFVYLTRLSAMEAPARYRLSYRRQGRSFTAVGQTLAEIFERLERPPGSERKCSRCGLVKDRNQFPRRPDRSGRASHCILCDRRRQQMLRKMAKTDPESADVAGAETAAVD